MRGTSRTAQGLAPISDAGIEAALADPARPASVLDHVSDVTVVALLLGSATAEPEALAAIHGSRLERLVEKLVDTPLRGLVYEGAGSVPARHLKAGSNALAAASTRWHIPVRIIDTDPANHDEWLDDAVGAVSSLV